LKALKVAPLDSLTAAAATLAAHLADVRGLAGRAVARCRGEGQGVEAHGLRWVHILVAVLAFALLAEEATQRAWARGSDFATPPGAAGVAAAENFATATALPFAALPVHGASWGVLVPLLLLAYFAGRFAAK
jgi:hypothetical protein